MSLVDSNEIMLRFENGRPSLYNIKRLFIEHLKLNFATIAVSTLAISLQKLTKWYHSLPLPMCFELKMHYNLVFAVCDRPMNIFL